MFSRCLAEFRVDGWCKDVMTDREMFATRETLVVPTQNYGNYNWSVEERGKCIYGCSLLTGILGFTEKKRMNHGDHLLNHRRFIGKGN